MLTVIVAFVGSGKSRTRRPFERRYSVMPSTEVTFSGLPGAAAGAFFAVVGALDAGLDWGLAADWVVAARFADTRIARSRPRPLLFGNRILGVLHASSGHVRRAG